MKNNQIQVIQPYKRDGVWQFDDESKGLRGEAFVAGADDIVEAISQEIPGAERGFTLIFSHVPFPGHTLRMDHDGKGEVVGDYYIHQPTKKRAWLCPALGHYFNHAPKHIYAQAKPISGRNVASGTTRKKTNE